MITPNDFYQQNDLPDKGAKQRMWNSISRSVPAKKSTTFFALERKSFLYGMAASFIVIFTCIGIYSTFVGMIEVALPQEIRTDKAYQSAIKEFENIALVKSADALASGKNDRLSVQTIRLQYLNEAIDELKQETRSNDLSPLKRLRLHELYGMKLKLLQEMVQQGDLRL